jgi:hypothetical protein
MNIPHTILPANANGIVTAYSSRRYAILFYSLLATLAAGPVLNALAINADFLEVFLAANLLAAVIPMASGNRGFLLTGLLLVACVLRYGAAWLDKPTPSVVGLALWAVTALLAAASTLRFAARAKSVDSEHLYAAMDAFLLAGVFLGVLYWVIEYLSPGSITMARDGAGSEFSISTAIYFSFVTLATVGYGDVVPQSETARGIAIVEAVAGQFYLAVLIARLVSLYGRNAIVVVDLDE